MDECKPLPKTTVMRQPGSGHPSEAPWERVRLPAPVTQDPGGRAHDALGGSTHVPFAMDKSPVAPGSRACQISLAASQRVAGCRSNQAPENNLISKACRRRDVAGSICRVLPGRSVQLVITCASSRGCGRYSRSG
jgi:hypothetical protein